MKLLFISLLALLTTTVSAEKNISLPDDIKPFFVHKTIEDAWSNPTHDGIYCYAVEQKNVVGPFVDIYLVEDGKVTEVISQGSNGKELIERIRKIGLTSFDYHKEVKETIKKLEEEYKEKGKKYFPPMVLDGHIYEIYFELDDIELKFNASNPGHEIYELSKHSENIGKLYALYKELMLYYAERKFHFK